MPRSRTRAMLYPSRAPHPGESKARRAKLIREFDRRLDLLFAVKVQVEARGAEGLSPGEDPCGEAANTPSMPR